MKAVAICAAYMFLVTSISGFFFSRYLFTKSNWIEKILVGLVVSNTFFSFTSLFYPTNSKISLIYLGLCIVLCVICFSDIYRYFALLFKENYGLLLFLLPLFFVSFINSLYPITVFDSGLYHIQAIKWIEEYPVVPGLANLSGRIGFNPNVFVLFAATSFEDFFAQNIYVVNLVVNCIVLTWLVKKSYNYIKNGYYLISIIFIVAFLIILRNSDYISSPSPDFIILTVTIYILLRFIDLKINHVESFGAYLPIVLLSVYIITVKASAFPILLVALIVFISYKGDFRTRKTVFLLLASAIVLVPWLIRNIILTGWLVYPVSALDFFNFDWEVPKSDLSKMKDAIVGWARNPGNDHIQAAQSGFFHWFPIWWAKQSILEKFIFIVCCTSPILALILTRMQSLRISINSVGAIYFACFFGFVFWFLTAPDWRFGIPFVMLTVMSPFLFIKRIRFPSWKPMTRIMQVVFIGLSLSLFVGPIVYYDKNFYGIVDVPPKISRLNWKSAKSEVKFETFIVDGKLSVKYPVGDYRCFDEELPCASYLPPKQLHLRGESLEGGFYNSRVSDK